MSGVRVDQVVWGTNGMAAEYLDSRSVLPPPEPTASTFYEAIMQTYPEHWWPLDDRPAMVNGKGVARDIGRLGGITSMLGYGRPSEGVVRSDHVSNQILYSIPDAENRLKSGGVLPGLSHVPPSTGYPTPGSYEFNHIGRGTGSVTMPISQTVRPGNASFMFFFRAHSWTPRQNDYAGYTANQMPWQTRIIGEYDFASDFSPVVFDVSAQGRMTMYCGDDGANLLTNPLELERIYQVLVIFTTYKVTLFIDGVEIGHLDRDESHVSGIGGTGTLRVGGVRTENFGQRLFQGEVSNVIIWNYAFPLTRAFDVANNYQPAWVGNLRKPAVVMATALGGRQSSSFYADRSYEMSTAVRTAQATAMIKTDGPAPPPDKFGLLTSERLRLMASSVQGLKLALVTSIGGEATAGTEITGGGYVRQSVAFTVDSSGMATSLNLARFTDIPPSSVLGWELWADSQRRWYGFWSPTEGTWALTEIFSASHGLVDGDKVIFIGSAPTGATANIVYYVRDATASTFKVSATVGGSVVALTEAGKVRYGRALEVPVIDSVEIQAGHLKLKLT